MPPKLTHLCCTAPYQGDVYNFLKEQGGAEGRLAEEVVVPLVLEPFMQALQYIHEKVGQGGARGEGDRTCRHRPSRRMQPKAQHTFFLVYSITCLEGRKSQGQSQGPRKNTRKQASSHQRAGSRLHATKTRGIRRTEAQLAL